MIYRLYTEDKNRDSIVAIVSRAYNSFTLFQGVGYWLGRAEQCLVIEIIAGEDELGVMEAIIGEIKNCNSQDCVLLVMTPEESKLI